jgi:tetratricopeptide (TPR) repeat protein
MLASYSVRLKFFLVALLLSGGILDAPWPTLAAQETPNLKRREKIHRYLYAIYTKQGNDTEQVNELNELIKLQPRNAHFQFLLGMAEIKQNNFREAIVHFDEAIKISRNFEIAYELEADCYSRLGETAKASEASKKFYDARHRMDFVGDFGPSDFGPYGDK